MASAKILAGKALLVLLLFTIMAVARADNSTVGNASMEAPINTTELVLYAIHEALPWFNRPDFGFKSTRLVNDVNVTCADFVEISANNMTETAKLQIQIATQLMAFIPAIITIAKIHAPRSSEAYATSFFIGFLSATYRLGLPVQSVSGVRADKSLSIGDFSIGRLEKMYEYGGWVEKSGRFFRLPWQRHLAPKAFPVSIDEIRHWFDPHNSHPRIGMTAQYLPSIEKFMGLKPAVKKYSRLNYRWLTPKHLIGLAQFLAMVTVLWPATWQLTVFPIWQCNAGSTFWLLALAAVSIVVETGFWYFSDHELVKIWRLPSLYRVQYLFNELEAGHETAATHIPPLRVDNPPWVTLARAVVKSFFRISFFLRHPWKAFWSNSARRKHVTVLLYLKRVGQSPFKRAFVGFLQGLFLILATFFFGSFWGGNLVYALALLIILLTVITVGRSLGIAFVRWTSQTFGLYVIECDNKIQIRGMMRLLSCMGEHNLVHINGAMYVNGIRVDDIPDFRRYLNDLEKGTFDHEDSPQSEISAGKEDNLSSAEMGLPDMVAPGGSGGGGAVHQEVDMFHDEISDIEPPRIQHQHSFANSWHGSHHSVAPVMEPLPGDDMSKANEITTTTQIDSSIGAPMPPAAAPMAPTVDPVSDAAPAVTSPTKTATQTTAETAPEPAPAPAALPAVEETRPHATNAQSPSPPADQLLSTDASKGSKPSGAL